MRHGSNQEQDDKNFLVTLKVIIKMTFKRCMCTMSLSYYDDKVHKAISNENLSL